VRYEGQLYRPPSEADAYILQATIGCSWNACVYCDMYRDKRFRVRDLDASLADLATAAARAVGELLDGSSLSALDEWEVPPADVARACGGLRTLAARLESPPRARLAALDALASTHDTCTATG